MSNVVSIYRAEKIVVIAILFTTALFLWFDISFRDPVTLYLNQIKFSFALYPFALFIAYIIAVVRSGIAARKAGHKVQESQIFARFRSEYLNWSRLIRDFRLINVILLVFVVFANLKHLVPLINSNIYDQQLYEIEKVVFGRSLTEILLQLFGSSAASFFSGIYTAYYPFMTLTAFFLIMQRERDLAPEFTTAFGLMWFLGILMVYLYPTWGPCFYAPQLLTGVPVTSASEVQAELWKLKLYLEQNPKSPTGLFLISGLPSLHQALTILASYYVFRVSRFLGYLCWVFCGLTLFSTVYLGWHWVLDNVTAVPLVLISIAVARWKSKPTESISA